ncbi:MAG: hypothetical protein CM1200mP41_18600 [Gammaproteobacteria bacterium]|nr:MAG: hypothetical protein CM1200mP41_18600 [Gammaproteobacteria bacterium]
MFLTQALQTTGPHVVGIADLNIKRAQHNLSTAGWDPLPLRREVSRYGIPVRHDVRRRRRCGTIAYERLDVIIEGPPAFPVPGSNTAVVPSMPAITWSW